MTRARLKTKSFYPFQPMLAVLFLVLIIVYQYCVSLRVIRRHLMRMLPLFWEAT